MQIYFHSHLCSYLPRVPILVEDTVYSKLTYFPEGQQLTKNVFFIGLMKHSNLLR